MSNTGANTRNPSGEGGGPDETARMDELLDTVDEWKRRVDHIKVQLTLAKDELLERLPDHLETARHVNRDAAPKLRVAYGDALETARSLGDGVEQILRDIKDVVDAVQRAMPEA